MIEQGKDYLLYDGDCGICSWSSAKAKQIDRKGQFMIEPYQAFPEDELLKFGITYERCAGELQVITHRGRVHSGAFGINYFLWRNFPWSLLAVLIYILPVLLLIELIGYRLVADNRQRISKWLGMEVCILKK